ncbi:hypothetical protein [Olivibacter sitiensis]|uniref:hypothetical protein n=1 Tax=Olivibacter sitiensis TaxID=376470 RepID=UPI0004264D4F|nr:hypothetical protein [Olivibacter sitiensis]
MICELVKLEEVYRTKDGAVLQCNNKNCFWLEFAGNHTAFRVQDFLQFKKTVDQIDLEDMLIDSSRASDYTLLMPFRTQRCFLLDVTQLLALKEILQGAMFMLELNSLLKACLTDKPMVSHN